MRSCWRNQSKAHRSARSRIPEIIDHITIRPADRVADAEDYWRIHCTAQPPFASPVAVVRRGVHFTATDPKPWDCMIAEFNGEVAGWASYATVARRDPPQTIISVMVAPEHQHQGVGTALWSALETTLAEQDRTNLVCSVVESSGVAIRFAENRGFQRAEIETLPTFVQSVAERPREHVSGKGIVVRPFAMASDLDALHGLHAEIGPETPTWAWGRYDNESMQEFSARQTEMMEDGGAILVAIDGEEIVGTTSAERLAHVPGAHVGLTAVPPAYRGRGIGRMLKVALADWAARSGLEFLVTLVHEENPWMLAINQSVGYRPVRKISMSRL